MNTPWVTLNDTLPPTFEGLPVGLAKFNQNNRASESKIKKI